MKQSFYTKQGTLERTDSLKSKIPMDTTELMTFPPKKASPKKHSLD